MTTTPDQENSGSSECYGNKTSRDPDKNEKAKKWMKIKRLDKNFRMKEQEKDTIRKQKKREDPAFKAQETLQKQKKT